jgi:hypothetical protein
MENEQAPQGGFSWPGLNLHTSPAIKPLKPKIKERTMKKTLIALAAAATLAVGFSATAKADPFGFGFGYGGYGYGHPHFGFAVSEGYGYGDGYGYGWGRPRCHTEWVQGWNHPHRILVCRR